MIEPVVVPSPVLHRHVGFPDGLEFRVGVGNAVDAILVDGADIRLNHSRVRIPTPLTLSLRPTDPVLVDGDHDADGLSRILVANVVHDRAFARDAPKCFEGLESL